MTASLPDEAPAAEFALRLYVTGTTMRSAKAIANLRRLCDEELTGRYALEVVDIYKDPDAAREHQILAAPTLIKLSPAPMRRIIGDLSDRGRLRLGLGLSPSTAGDGR